MPCQQGVWCPIIRQWIVGRGHRDGFQVYFACLHQPCGTSQFLILSVPGLRARPISGSTASTGGSIPQAWDGRFHGRRAGPEPFPPAPREWTNTCAVAGHGSRVRGAPRVDPTRRPGPQAAVTILALHRAPSKSAWTARKPERISALPARIRAASTSTCTYRSAAYAGISGYFLSQERRLPE